jgi:hypothetical protein
MRRSRGRSVLSTGADFAFRAARRVGVAPRGAVFADTGIADCARRALVAECSSGAMRAVGARNAGTGKRSSGAEIAFDFVILGASVAPGRAHLAVVGAVRVDAPSSGAALFAEAAFKNMVKS